MVIVVEMLERFKGTVFGLNASPLIANRFVQGNGRII